MREIERESETRRGKREKEPDSESECERNHRYKRGSRRNEATPGPYNPNHTPQTLHPEVRGFEDGQRIVQVHLLVGTPKRQTPTLVMNPNLRTRLRRHVYPVHEQGGGPQANHAPSMYRVWGLGSGVWGLKVGAPSPWQ